MADTPKISLRRCPFCGRKATLGKGQRRKKDFEWIDGTIEKAGDWLWKPSVGCRNCKFSRKFDSVEEAAAWWNGESR